MSSVKINDLNTIDTLTSGDKFVVWDGSTKATTLQQITDFVRSNSASFYVHRVIATAGQTVFTLPVSYVVGAGAVQVFVNGLRLEGGIGQDFIETSTTSIAFTTGLALNDLVTVVIFTFTTLLPVNTFPADAVSPFGAALIDDVDAVAARTTLGMSAQSTTGTTTGFTAGSGSAVLADSTFTGNTGSAAYTIGDIVRALKAVGLLAS
jgi:hypothetical protein